MCSKQKINKLQKLQNRCLRLITNKKHLEPHKNKNLGILPIEKLINLELYKTSYKLLKNDLPVRIIECLTSDKDDHSLRKKHKYNTRNKHIPRYSRSLSSKYSNSFLHQCTKSFSALPVATRNKAMFQPFVSSLKNYLHDS